MKIIGPEGLKKILEERPQGGVFLVPELFEILRSSQEVVLEGEKVSPSRLMDELEADSLFGPRTVIVRGANKLLKGVLEALSAYFERPNPKCRLVLEGGTPTLQKRVEAVGVVVGAPNIPPWEQEDHLIGWLIKEYPLARDAAWLLVQRIGFDKELLRREAEKVLCYVGADRKVEKADVAAVVVGQPHDSIWELGKAVQKREAQTAVQVWRHLQTQGSVPLALIASMRAQLQTGWQLAAHAAGGQDRHTIAKSFPKLRGKMLDRNLEMARGYGLGRYQRALVALQDLELRCKSESLSDSAAFENLLVKLCH